MERLKIYFLCTRPQFFLAVIIPVALGASSAWETDIVFNLPHFALSLLAAVLFHAGVNVMNDYFDFRNGADNANVGALKPFTGGSGFIQRGLISPGATIVFAALLLGGGSLVGLYLAYKTTWALVIIGSVGLVSGVFYSAPPLFLAGRGLGEITVGINFGVLTVLGSYMVQTGHPALEPVFAALAISFLISGLLYINEFPDYLADKRAGKRTLVVRLGPRKARYVLLAYVALAYSSIIVGAAFGLIPLLSLVALVSLVFALAAARGLIRHYRGGPELIPSIKAIILAHASAGLLLIFANIL
jgi:1,4-dihydroxy-2-naphthoate octaprenyltransferase